MPFKLTDEQEMMRDKARDFLQKEILSTPKEDEKEISGIALGDVQNR